MPKAKKSAGQSQSGSERFEVGRGALQLAILAVLSRGSACGYQIAKELRAQDEALALEYGVLYPMLERMESKGIIKGRWEKGGRGPNGLHMYDITPAGRKSLEASQATWLRVMNRVRSLIKAGS